MDNLREIKDVLDNKGIKFWLEGGTLLGAVRDGKIIDWDSDVDLGTWYDNVKQMTLTAPDFRRRHFMVALSTKRCSASISKHGCSVYVHLYRKRSHYAWTVSTSGFNAMKVRSKVYSPREKIIEKLLRYGVAVLIQEMKTVRAELFVRARALFPSTLRQRVADKLWYVLDRLGCINVVVIPKRYFEKLATIQFYGMQFNIPSDVEKYLKFRYGKDWKTPIKIWKYKDDGAKNPKIRLCDFLVST